MAYSISDKMKKALIKAAKETEEKYRTIIKKELDDKYEDVITEWYDSYHPNSYIRKGRLYDMFTTYIVGKSIRYKFYTDAVDYGNSFLDDYIYNIVIEEGWHGGANNGYNHPDPGTPWYRNIKNNTWLRESEMAPFSPYNYMKSEMEFMAKKWEKDIVNDFINNVKKYM